MYVRRHHIYLAILQRRFVEHLPQRSRILCFHQIVASSEVLSVDEDVGHSPLTSLGQEEGLNVGPLRLVV